MYNKKRDIKKKKMGVYKISCDNGYSYYGSSGDIDARFISHLSSLKTGKHPCKKMQNHFDTLGEDAFEFDIIDETTSYKEACILEGELIKKDISAGHLYNKQVAVIKDAPRGSSLTRFSLSVTDRQYERLLKCSRRIGISLGELIRRIFDKWEDEE